MSRVKLAGISVRTFCIKILGESENEKGASGLALVENLFFVENAFFVQKN